MKWFFSREYIKMRSIAMIIIGVVITSTFSVLSGPIFLVQFDVVKNGDDTYTIKNQGALQAKEVTVTIHGVEQNHISIKDCPEISNFDYNSSHVIQIHMSKFSSKSSCTVQITDETKDISFKVFSEDRQPYHWESDSKGDSFHGYWYVGIVFGFALIVAPLMAMGWEYYQNFHKGKSSMEKTTKLQEYMVNNFGNRQYTNYDDKIIESVFYKNKTTTSEISTEFSITNSFCRSRLKFLKKLGILECDEDGNHIKLNGHLIEILKEINDNNNNDP